MNPFRKGGRKTLASDDDCGDDAGPPSQETRAEKRLRGYTERAEISLPRSGLLEPSIATERRIGSVLMASRLAAAG